VICPTTVLKKKSIQLSYTCLKEEKKTKEKQVELKQSRTQKQNKRKKKKRTKEGNTERDYYDDKLTAKKKTSISQVNRTP